MGCKASKQQHRNKKISPLDETKHFFDNYSIGLDDIDPIHQKGGGGEEDEEQPTIEFSTTEEGFSMMYPKHSKLLGRRMITKERNKPSYNKASSSSRFEQRDDSDGATSFLSEEDCFYRQPPSCPRDAATVSTKDNHEQRDISTTCQQPWMSPPPRSNNSSNKKKESLGMRRRRSPQTYGLRAAERYYFSDRSSSSSSDEEEWKTPDGVFKIDDSPVKPPPYTSRSLVWEQASGL